MSARPVFDEQFTAQLKAANLLFDTVLKCAQLRTGSWTTGAAIFGAGAAFSGVLSALYKVLGS